MQLCLSSALKVECILLFNLALTSLCTSNLVVKVSGPDVDSFAGSANCTFYPQASGLGQIQSHRQTMNLMRMQEHLFYLLGPTAILNKQIRV